MNAPDLAKICKCDQLIRFKIDGFTIRTHLTFAITGSDISSAINRLEHNKKDSDSEVVSDHIIYAGGCLGVHMAILFTAMLRHGLTPEVILNGTMVPFPKGRWADFPSSDKFNTITLGSI